MMETLLPSAVTPPKLIPLVVTVNADVPTVAPDVAITTDVTVVTPHVAVSPATLLAAPATMGEEAKKLEGWVRVMVPPEGMGVVCVKARVTGTEDLFMTLSVETMLKQMIPVTVMVLIPPEATPADATVSASFCTMMPVALPAVAAPIVTPLRVMVTAVVAAMPTTAVVMTMELPDMADVAVIVLTDVLPAALAAGLGVAAKNPAG